MGSGAGETTTEPVRPVWVLTPLESVGPLRFGMSADEARAALPEAVELSRFSAEPFYPEIYGLQLGFPKRQKGELVIGREVRWFTPADGPGVQDVISRAYRLGMKWTPGRK
ncbi:hypothetical protein ACFCWY_11695 [Streptomyces sp. NPDC056362]|uniref:hypothetical protein n=1 Tax=unclassified Streptomyces TaxID=2593676 RepID=UPI0035DCFC3B